ncbi:CopD family protein [Peterkaempfera sp. SMS 1(5)a]|uniref:CopD family protein n=1 Tax=Peterkaempfera podocarpi TaxID=3232308 RepID=UPI003670A866
MSISAALPYSAAPAPSTPLGPFADTALTWTTWVALMGFVGLAALALVAAGPAARRIGPDTYAAVTARLAAAAAALGLLAVPAALTDNAHAASESGGYDYGSAWNSLYDGSTPGLLWGLDITLCLVGAALVAPLASRRFAAGPARAWLLGGGLAAGAVALITTKFPDKKPDNWGRTVFGTLMWVLHLLGGAVWIGGLIGLLLLALSSRIRPEDRAVFWSPAIRRFSVTAMSCVAAITLSGLFLYWGHVDGPSQLVTTMYGRVLGVKILIFGAMLLLGVFNQFWLHPRIDALRAAGDQRPLRTILFRTFPVVVGVEVALALALLFVAPFLHGSARNQAFQADAAKHATTASVKDLPKLPAKQAHASTWILGTAETAAVIALMVAGYRVSGRLARRRTALVAAPSAPADPDALVQA